MTVEFFEGPAGSGKTHSLIERVRQLVNAKALGEGQRVLALTFMNGARRRLEASLGKFPELRRRVECKTVDVFAQSVVARRTSLLDEYPSEVEAARELNLFDSKCSLAAHLLQFEAVTKWVAASFPLVLVDEAQDLDAHRLPILKRMETACLVLAAADEFQCLDTNVATCAVMSWLGSCPNPTRLDGSKRTTQSGILQVAQAVRNAKDVLPLLQRIGRGSIWRAPGFKLIETPGKKELLAWSISNELNGWIGKGNVAIVTPHKGSTVVREALTIVQGRTWTYSSGGNFGPFQLEWELDEKERAEELCKQLELPDVCGLQNVTSTNVGPLNDPALVRVRARMHRYARVTGERAFSNAKVVEMVGDAVRDVARFGGRRGLLRAAMSIHRAKNREFKNVIVLWPYSIKEGADYRRRLLYNAITRAQQNCTVIVLGKNRLAEAPWAGEAALAVTAQARRTSGTKRAPSGRPRKSTPLRAPSGRDQ